MRLCILCLAIVFIGTAAHLAQSAENLALRPDAVPIARVTAPTGSQPEDINIIKNEVTTEESYDSYDGANAAAEDWYGYTWSEQLYFDTLVFYEGTPSAAGGYWKSLTVQYTIDGTRWIEAGNVAVAPQYDYSDDPERPPYSRYDLTFTGCLGTGVRIYGQPGGPCFYISIAELEVYGTKPHVVCTRELPTSYEVGQNISVSLTLDVDAENVPTSLTLVELIPAGLTVADPGTGDTSQPDEISWSFGEGEVASQTLNYSLAVPEGHSSVINSSGTLSYPSTPSQDITGSQAVAPFPLPPTGLSVTFDVDANLSWSPGAQEGLAGYRVYRSEALGDFADISGLILDSSYIDHFVEEGKTYRYKVVSQNTTGAASDLADSPASTPRGPSMLKRQFEDYDFEGGNYPGGEFQRGFRAGFRSDLDFRDFYYQSDQQTNAYRPDDPIAIPPFNTEEYYVGSTTPSDWWRYTFDVPADGYVKIGAIRAASEGDAIVEFLWDELHVGWFSFNTEGSSNWQIIPVDVPTFHSPSGKHTLRIILSVGDADFDYFGIGFEQPEPSRTILFKEDFENYSTTAEIIAPRDEENEKGGWTIVGSGVGGGEGAWQLWTTTGDPLGYESPDLPGMIGKYAISDGEFAGPGDLDEQLISPEIDCTGYVGVLVEFGSNIEIYEPDIGVFDQVYDLDLQTYDEEAQSWSDWANVFHHEGADGDDSSPHFVDVSGLADGKRIKLRWRFWEANYDYWWAVDNIRVTAETPAAETGRILSIAVAGDTISLTWESFSTGYYRVQYTDDLTSGTWSDVPGQTWPITEEQWTGDDVSATKSRFYRVISDEGTPPVPGKILSVEITGDTISLTWESFGTGSYRVQYREDLTSGAWSDISDAVSETSWTGAILPEGKTGFYRVISSE
ncbi:hypothetical protein HQ563_17740 [bacterium]|nr:hypothetical protein [bacterium]